MLVYIFVKAKFPFCFGDDFKLEQNLKLQHCYLSLSHSSLSLVLFATLVIFCNLLLLLERKQRKNPAKHWIIGTKNRTKKAVICFWISSK